MTDPKHIERALLESEARFHRLVENAQVAVIRHRLGPEPGIAYVSPSVEQVLGYKPEDFYERPELGLELVHPDDRERLERECTADPEAVFVGRGVRADGGVAWIERRQLLVRDESGVPIALEATLRDVTVHVDAAEAHRARERQWRAVFEEALDAFVIADDDRAYVAANPAACELFGVPLEELVGKRIDDFTPPGGLESLETRWRALLESGSARGEVTVVRPDGEERLAEISATANVLPGQHIAVLRDISSRRAGELALFDSEARFRGAFDQAPIGMALVAPDGSWLEVNKAICDLVGYSEAELLQTNFQALTHPDDLAADLEQLEATLAGEIDSYTMEKRYFHKDGHVVLVLLSVSLVRDHAGTPRYFVSQVKDIGERKQAEQLQAASERRYRDLFENAYDALYSLDAEGRLTDANRAFEHLAGRSLDEMLGHSIVGILAPDSRGAGRRRLAARLLGRSPHGFECTITSREGAHVQVEITSRLIVENGEVVGVQGVAREIGTRKRLEEERRLGQKLEAVGRLAGGIAHDFNNLLTAIRGYTDLALLRAGAETPLDEILEIRRAAEQASRLTRQLLAFGRKQVLELRVLDLNSVVASTETMLRRVIGEQVQLETKLGADLGRVKADPSQLEQVIVNLVVNARDAMSEGGRVTIETARLELDEESARQHPPVPAGRYVTLTVTDTGRGIDAKTRRQLFEPFFTTKEPGHGTGLGLATVYGIVKQSRGYIRVDSEPGAGARFTIYLQAVREPLTKDERELPPRRPDAKRAAARILVAEDEEIVRRLLSKILAADGHTVLAAANGEEALELARASDVELLITDVVMPGMGGPELLRRLREGKPDLPAIYISGHSEAAVSRNGKLSPGAIFVQKPFAYEELAATVAALLT